MAKHQPVDKALAAACVTKYKDIYQNSTDPAVKKAYSDGLVFDREELISWLNGITTPSVKITFGVYTADFVQTHPSAREDRLTTFIFPSTTVPSATINTALAGIAGAAGGGMQSGDGNPYNLAQMEP